jgi:hypothetical protein
MEIERAPFESEPASPLAVDPALAERHFARRNTVNHVVATVITVGLWLPILVVALLFRGRFAARDAAGYAVRISDGHLCVGNPARTTMIPLERIRAVSIEDELLHVLAEAKVQVFGLTDPTAAARRILAARDEKLGLLRAVSENVGLRGRDVEHSGAQRTR